jgi:hypothetical protein
MSMNVSNINAEQSLPQYTATLLEDVELNPANAAGRQERRPKQGAMFFEKYMFEAK